MSSKSVEEFGKDYAFGMASFGIPEMYHMAKALYEGDEEALMYSLKLSFAVHGTWYSAWQLNRMWDFYRHGGKNIQSFHKSMQGVNVARGMAWRASAPTLVAGAVIGGTIHAIETGDTRYTIPHLILEKPISSWLSGLGDDSRGGSEYALFG